MRARRPSGDRIGAFDIPSGPVCQRLIRGPEQPDVHASNATAMLSLAQSLVADSKHEKAIEVLEAIPGGDETTLLNGGSAVIGPDSHYVKGPLIGESGIILADIDTGRMTEGHLFLDTSGHYSRPDVFHLEVNDKPMPRVDFKSQRE